jgi:hypothetical protein
MKSSQRAQIDLTGACCARTIAGRVWVPQARVTTVELALHTPRRPSPNYARLFAEAVEDSVRDYYLEHREAWVPGYWTIKWHRRGPPIPARTFWCDHEPGDKENKLDQPFLAGEIAGNVVDPLDIIANRDRAPLQPRGGLTVEREYAFQVADIRHARQWRPHEPIANPRHRVRLSRLPIPFVEDN